LRGGLGAVFNNSGTFDAQNDSAFTNGAGGAASAFNNTGMFLRTGGGTTTFSGVLFNNGSTVSVTGGTLDLSGGGMSSGSFTVAATFILEFGGGTHTLTGSSSVSGAGTVRFTAAVVNHAGTFDITGSTVVTAGTAAFTGTVLNVGSGVTVSGGTLDFSSGEVVTTGTLTQTGGTLTGTDEVVVTVLLDWTGGVMSGAGTTTVQPAAALNISGGFKQLLGRTVNNQGTAVWTGASELRGGLGAVFNNSGTFDAQNDSAFTNGAGGAASSFNNTGTFTKSGIGTITTFSSVSFSNAGGVTVAASTTLNLAGGFTQTAGTTTLNGGTLSSNTALSIQGGMLGGNGTINGSVSNGGNVSPGFTPGGISINGNYAQTATGILTIELGGLVAGVDFDALTITGTATLGGTLNVSSFGGFTPVSGNSFQILTYGSRSGDFAAKNGLNFPTITLQSVAGATTYTLVAGAPVDVAVTKVGAPDPVDLNAALTYTLMVTNNGPNAAGSVVLTDPLPAGVAFVSAMTTQGACMAAGGTVTCNLGSIAMGGLVTVTINTTVTAGGILTNTATVTTADADTNNTNNSATAMTTVRGVADLAIAKSASPDPVTVGNALTYTVTVTNLGPNAATSLVITDTLPAGVTLISATVPGGTCTGTTVVTCNVANLAVNGTVNATLVVTANTTGSVTNMASVVSADSDPNSANNMAMVTSQVAAATCVPVPLASVANMFTSSSAFFAAISGAAATTETYEGLPLNSLIPAGTTVNGITYNTFPAGASGRVDNFFNRIGLQSLALRRSGCSDAACGFFNPGDSFSVTFPTPVNAVGIFLNAFAGFPNTLFVSDGVSTAFNGPTQDTSSLYFVGLISNTEFTTATIGGTAGSPTFNVDNLTFARVSLPASGTSGLLAWYRGEGDATDLTGAHNGTLQNGATFAAGKVGQAFQLDGIDDHVSVPDSPSLDGMAQLTVDAWVKFDSLAAGDFQFVVTKGSVSGTGTNSYAIWVDGPSLRLQAALETTTNLITLSAPDALLVGRYYHVALTYDGATARFFLDGVLKSSTAISGPVRDTAFPLFLGRRSGPGADGQGDPLTGQIDEVEIFGRALSDAEIAAIHNTGSAGKCVSSSDLSVAKTDSSDPVLLGTNLTYAVTVTNNGPDPALDVVLTDPLPAGVNFVSATTMQGACTQTAGTVQCNLGALAALASTNVTIVVTPTATGQLTNTATVSLTGVDPVPGNNSATETTTVNASADFVVTKAASPNPAIQNRSLTYTIVVTNSGPSPASGITLSDPLPANLNFGSAVPSQGTCLEMSGTVTCALGSLASGTSASVIITVTPTALGTLTNTVTVTANEPDPNAANNLFSLDTNVITGPIVSLSTTMLTFAGQTVGTTSAAQIVTLSNTGNDVLLISSIAAGGDFAQTNTCGASLGAGGSCVITITFTPTATGTRTGSVTITSNAPGSPHVIDLVGTGITSAAITLSTVSLVFQTQSVNTTSPAQPVTLTNTGNATLQITSITVTGDFAQTNNCGATVAIGGTCTISVTFTPTAAGIRSGGVTILSNARGSAPVITLTGVGASPGISLSTALLTFAAQPVGTTSAPQSVTLSNGTTSALVITSITITGDFAQTNNCGASVAAGSSCTITITFGPTATGTRNGTLTITDSGVGSPRTVSLTGTGIAAGLALSTNNLGFPDQPVGITSAPLTVTLTNSGGVALAISSITISGDFAQTNNCGASLGAGASCTISVTFTPSATGIRNGTITITSSAQGSPHLVALFGVGLGSAPVLTFSPASLSFGTVAVGSTSAAQTLTVSNTGNATLTIQGVVITGDFALAASGTTMDPPCVSGSMLAPGTSCAIHITFTPLAGGTRGGSASVSSNAGGSPHSATLTGTGQVNGPAVALSPGSVTFVGRPLGTTSVGQLVTLTNTGNAALTITNITVTGDFAQTNNCGANLAAQAACTITITFTPVATGTRNGVLTITDNAAGSPHTVPLFGSGTDVLISTPPGASSSADVAAGQMASYQLMLTPAGGFSERITISCTGAVPGGVCGASPNDLVLTTPTMVTITFTTAARSSGSIPWLVRPLPPFFAPRIVLPWMIGFALMLWLATLAAARRRRSALAFAALVLAVVVSAGCAGGVNAPEPRGQTAGTPAGSYSIVVTATSASGLSRSTTLNLTVR
jgi:uncharacterized repeat protein (TIGR01451 family)